MSDGRIVGAGAPEPALASTLPSDSNVLTNF